MPIDLLQAEQEFVHTATTIINKVADQYKIPRPAIQYVGKRSSRAFCYYMPNGTSKISFGFNLWHRVETAMLHEMAHAVSWYFMRERGHDEGFQRTLKGIVRWWYNGDESKYQWDMEYVSVAASAGVEHSWRAKQRESAINSFVRCGMDRAKAEKLVDEQ